MLMTITMRWIMMVLNPDDDEDDDDDVVIIGSLSKDEGIRQRWRQKTMI